MRLETLGKSLGPYTLCSSSAGKSCIIYLEPLCVVVAKAVGPNTVSPFTEAAAIAQPLRTILAFHFATGRHVHVANNHLVVGLLVYKAKGKSR
jgi:hypothetical protein